MFEVGDLVRYYTTERFYYDLDKPSSDIGLIVNTQPKWCDSRDYNWYIVLLNGNIKTAREDDIYKLEEKQRCLSAGPLNSRKAISLE